MISADAIIITGLMIYAAIAFGVGVWVYTVNSSLKNALLIGGLWFYWLPRLWWILHHRSDKL